jgi:hypothetical protein
VKNKKFTYLLLGCVVLLWGLVFFKVYAAMNEEETDMVQMKPQKRAYLNLVNHENDTINIIMNYRNPFLESNMAPIIEPVKTILPMHQIATVGKKQVVNWIDIIYKGYINNQVAKQRIAIVFINGKETMLREGQTTNALKLLKFAGDSIKVSYQNETKFIKLK